MFIELTELTGGTKVLIGINHVTSLIHENDEDGTILSADDGMQTAVKESYKTVKSLLLKE